MKTTTTYLHLNDDDQVCIVIGIANAMREEFKEFCGVASDDGNGGEYVFE